MASSVHSVPSNRMGLASHDATSKSSNNGNDNSSGQRSARANHYQSQQSTASSASSSPSLPQQQSPRISHRHHGQRKSRFSHGKNDRQGRGYDHHHHHHHHHHLPLPPRGGVGLHTVFNNLDHVSHLLLSRRPLLHMVVLFANDMKMRRFAYDTEELFLQRGINVFMQMEALPKQFIKPEHLQEIITDSPADSLIVLGDKNMKNNTCHAKKSGKLVEVPVQERVNEVPRNWKMGVHASKLNQLLRRNLGELTEHNIYELVELFSGVKHLDNRLRRLENCVLELQDWKYPMAVTGERRVTHVPSPGRIGLGDEKMLTKLTTTQNAVIRLHRDFSKSFHMLERISVDDRNNGDTKKGLQLSMIEQNQISVSHTFKESLVRTCKIVLEKIVKLGGELSELANNSSLWDAYVSDMEAETASPPNTGKESAQDNIEDATNLKPSASSKRIASVCGKCTFENKPTALACEICGDSLGADWKETGKKSPRRKAALDSRAAQKRDTAASAKFEPRIRQNETVKYDGQNKPSQAPEPNRMVSATTAHQSPASLSTLNAQQQPPPQLQAFDSPMMQALFGNMSSQNSIVNESPQSSNSSSSIENMQSIDLSEAHPFGPPAQHYQRQFPQYQFEISRQAEMNSNFWANSSQQSNMQAFYQPSSEEYHTLDDARSRSSSNSSNRRQPNPVFASTGTTNSQDLSTAYTQFMDDGLGSPSRDGNSDIAQQMSGLYLRNTVHPSGAMHANSQGICNHRDRSQSLSQHSLPTMSQESLHQGGSPGFSPEESPTSFDRTWGGMSIDQYQPALSNPPSYLHLQQQQQQHFSSMNAGPFSNTNVSGEGIQQRYPPTFASFDQWNLQNPQKPRQSQQYETDFSSSVPSPYLHTMAAGSVSDHSNLWSAYQFDGSDNRTSASMPSYPRSMQPQRLPQFQKNSTAGPNGSGNEKHDLTSLEMYSDSQTSDGKDTHPCMVCGCGSSFGCNFCGNLRKKGHATPNSSTYFCGPEHQQAAFAHHNKS